LSACSGNSAKDAGATGGSGGTTTVGGGTGTGGITGGTVVASGGTVITTGGAGVATGGTVTTTGGAVVGTGGTVIATGGAVVASGGTVLTTGGTVVAGNIAGGAGGTSVTGGAGKGGTAGTPTGGIGTTGGSTGGAIGGSTGGATGGLTGGVGSGGTGGTFFPPPSNRVRTIISFDRDWLFNYGDASGADATVFVDSAWRKLNIPHDWAIEGPNPPANPFSSTAATTGRGGYAPSGIAWYRKHFTLPQLPAGRKVFIEFDGVMGNSTVYVNGTSIGNHPYGYVSFRYDITSNVSSTGDNVIAVKTDTTVQPASRFYAGAGIYRHVRLIATDPVHLDQWATFVTTPAPTTTSATVKVQTAVRNEGTASASVSVQGVVTDPDGTERAPVTTAAQTIAGGASASFTFDVRISNPKLWDTKTPNMYQLVTQVQVDGSLVDDETIPFGIREIKFNTGMTLNGNPVRFQGVCLHQDYHGLGLAAPQRAMQRRLAQLKVLGVNAIRTSHEPPSPDFLELTDRMGFLVLDEFTDLWAGSKWGDVGDYSRYFNKTATTPTGMPAVPTVTGVSPTGAPWWQVDFTGWIMRDRNHPSVALYSMGNEIDDSFSVRTPILTKMIAISHFLDPTRSDTQALLSYGTDTTDVGAATNTLLDVWGTNYNVATVLKGMVNAPTKSALITEMGTQTSTWAQVTANPGLTGEFMWTGVDYLGEADKAWPTVGATAGLMDELGLVKAIGYSWQTIWGMPKTTFSTGATAGKVVLTADHTAITTDLNDVGFVRAAVPTATAPVTFSLAGPGAIVAVDSGSMTQETFRGDTRNASGNLAYAIIQATGPGTITVTAKSAGLSDGTATVTATEGTFLPCSGTCD
jgi:beta-galactosidase